MTDNVIKSSTKIQMEIVEFSGGSFIIRMKPGFDPENWHTVGDADTRSDAINLFNEFGG